MQTTGIAILCCRLDHYSVASRARVGHASKVYGRLEAHLQQVLDDDDSLAAPPMEWINRSCLQAIATVLNRVDDLGIQVAEQSHIQRYLIKQLRDHISPIESIAPQLRHSAR